MSANERSATSGFVLAALLSVPPTAGAAPCSVPWMTPRTNTSASPDAIVSASVLQHVSMGTASGDEDVVDVLPNVEVTRLAAARSAGEGEALRGLYRRLVMATMERGHRINRFVLAGEDLADASSEDLILEVYVEGLDDADARLDLWEVLSEELEDVSSSAFLAEKLALVVHGPTV